MSRDFTLEKYEGRCGLLPASEQWFGTMDRAIAGMGVADYLASPKDEEFIAVLRHDVDKFPERAVRMALLEKHWHQTKVTTRDHGTFNTFTQPHIIPL